ncbi:unnamed protein product [Effrenium voratum]|uniref:Uncharacterized protein n=1 Tax=Effrenium voratum TaxID=2562239 RepID=A0AA36JIH8_9DINO|nr:unnamed protein product [Effrenium voratum]CAJ1458737.1 unnamed protein product [Effrenium voratum]
MGVAASGECQGRCGGHACTTAEPLEIESIGPRPVQEQTEDDAEFATAEDLPQTRGQLRLETKQQLDLDAELARGIPLHHALRTGRLWRLSPIDMALQERDRLWHLSSPVKKYDLFLSHTWQSSGTQKYLALLLQFACPLVFGAWAVAAALAFGLGVMDMLPSPFQAKYLFANSGVSEPVPLGCWILLSNLVSLCTFFAWPYLPQPTSKRCFLDAVSINQVDQQLMQRGVYGIGGFLSISQELRILWTPQYLSRLWCVFEIAMYRKANPSGKITLAPVYVEVVALCLWLTMVLLMFVQWSTWILGVTTNLAIGALLFSGVPVCWAIQRLRRSAYIERQLWLGLAEFDLQTAGCRMEFDKRFVHESIAQWYGSTGAFTEYVRGPLRQELAPSFRLPCIYYLAIMTPLMSAGLEELLSLVKSQEPWQSLVALVLGRTISMPVSLVLSFKFAMYMCTRFADPHPKYWVDLMRSLWIVFSCTLLAVLGVMLSLRTRRIGIGASVLWGLAQLGLAFWSFRRQAARAS